MLFNNYETHHLTCSQNCAAGFNHTSSILAARQSAVGTGPTESQTTDIHCPWATGSTNLAKQPKPTSNILDKAAKRAQSPICAIKVSHLSCSLACKDPANSRLC